MATKPKRQNSDLKEIGPSCRFKITIPLADVKNDMFLFNNYFQKSLENIIIM